jgi:hypothetical protein
MSQTDLAFVSSEFDIFFRKPVQHAIQETNLVVYKPIASIDQSDLGFLIPSDYDTYVDPEIKIYIRGKFTKTDGSELDATDFTLFSHCTFALNGVNIIQSGDPYNYRAYVKSLYHTVLTLRYRISQIATAIRIWAICYHVTPRKPSQQTQGS